MKVGLEQELGRGKSWVGGEEGPAFQCDYCLFEDTFPPGDSELVEWPGCKSGMERMQKRVGTSESCVREALFFGLQVGTSGSGLETQENGRRGSTAITKESLEKSWVEETSLLRDSPPINPVIQRPLGDGPFCI